MSAPLLEVQNVSMEYRSGSKRIIALAGVDLSLLEKETLGIIGESGSGKTTLANCILGLCTPNTGVITLKGIALTASRTRDVRRRIQVVQQNPYSTLNPKHTVFYSVSLPLRVHQRTSRKDMQDQVVQLLRLVDLTPDYMARFPRQLSGGQRQRVALARALACGPEIIIFDEPTSALDVSVQARILELLLKLQAKLGLTYLFVTHDLSVARALCHRIAVLYHGVIVESGPTSEIFDKPRHQYTRLLLSSVPVLTNEEEERRPTWPGDIGISGSGSTFTGCPFKPRCIASEEVCARSMPVRYESANHFYRCHFPYDGLATKNGSA